jgi:hypothetical protein
MSSPRTLTVLLVASLCAALGVRRLGGETLPVTKSLPDASERYDELAPILLPETAIYALPAGPDGANGGGDAVFAFVVDTLGRVELPTVETLAATDSATARDLRRGLERLRYIPKRIVLDVGRCVYLNGVRAHCGGSAPALKRLRARVVLHLQASTAQP